MIEKGKNQRMARRIVAVFYLMFWVFLLLLGRLFQVQVVEARRFSQLAQNEHSEKIVLPAVRGNIYDRSGELLATSLLGHSVAAFPSKISNKIRAAKNLSSVLGIPSSEILQMISTSEPFVWIIRKIEYDKAAAVKELEIPGIEVVDEPTGKRVYPAGKLACHVLGYTGIDDQGLDGAEFYYDKELRGTPGYLMAETDGLGRVLPQGVWKTVPAVPGGNITLTLDETIQYTAQRELEKGVKKSRAKSGSVIVMNPETGAILALANYPDFDGNRYGRYPDSVLRDRAISDDYEPGSTFKGILAAAALESGKVSRIDKFLSGPFIQVDGWKIHNAEDGFRMSSPFQNLDSIIENSFNVGAASVALKIGTGSFADMIGRFGFFRKTGIDLPGEAESLIPDPKTWSRVRLATAAFGQGIGITPIQLISAYAAIANGGYPVHPHILKAVAANGKTEENPETKAASPAISLRTDAVLKYVLSLVVEKGTGTQAAVPGYSTAGKTGTASVSEGGSYRGYIASFVGFSSVEKPAVVILVKVDKPRFPYWGGTVAAPVFRAIAQEALWVLNVPPTQAGWARFGPWKVWGEEEH